MYKYSHRADGPWMGEFATPQAALTSGRAMMSGVARVWVGQMERAYWSDMFIGVDALLAYMKEYASEIGDEFADPFDSLPGHWQRVLGRHLHDAIGEWEAEMPEELQFTGEIVKTKKGYTEAAMVRPADFSGT